MTNKPIGPTFGEELIAAGLGGLPISWSDTGEINGLQNLSNEQREGVEEVLDNHDFTKALLGPMEKLELRISVLEAKLEAVEKVVEAWKR